MMDIYAKELKRPDKTGYCIDPMIDRVVSSDGDIIVVIQVWVDPKRPNAHRDPALRAYLADMWQRFNLFAIVRFGNDGGFMLVPPNADDNTEWLEIESHMHSPEDLQAIMQAAKNKKTV
jgi:hypothetical protein